MNEEFILCPKCGARMKKTQRCCLKCGALNFENSENESMTKANKIAEKQREKEIRKGKYIDSDSKGIKMAFARGAGNRTVCLLVNIAVYLVVVGVLFSLKVIPLDQTVLRDYRYSLWFLATTFGWFYILSLQCLYMKTNHRWWSALIPFYNLYNWFEITMNKGWLFLLLFVPVVGEVVLLISLWNLGDRFSKSKLLCILFPFVMIPFLAYRDECLYDGINFSYNENNMEKGIMHNYKINKNILKYMMAVILLCCVLAGYSFVSAVKFTVKVNGSLKMDDNETQEETPENTGEGEDYDIELEDDEYFEYEDLEGDYIEIDEDEDGEEEGELDDEDLEGYEEDFSDEDF